jgi:hypothetical protein
MASDLLIMVFNFYDFYDKSSLFFSSENYERHFIQDKEVKNINRVYTEIIDERGEVISFHSDEDIKNEKEGFRTYKKPDNKSGLLI